MCFFSDSWRFVEAGTTQERFKLFWNHEFLQNKRKLFIQIPSDVAKYPKPGDIRQNSI